MRALLDTNAVSEMFAPARNPRVVAYLQSLDPENTFLSSVSMGEMTFGVERLERGRRRVALQQWLDGVESQFSGRILPVSTEVGKAWGRIRYRAQLAGRPIQVADGLIAATATAADLTVITRNVKDFESTGVATVNPWADSEA